MWGANIGFTALVLERSVRAEGRVLAFEPSPFVLPTLRTNVSEWKSLQIAPIEVEAIALSDRNGEAILGFPDGYTDNEGIASLELSKNGISVSVRRLDSLDTGDVGIMKMDGEGHEAVALSGATRLLKRKATRDILFEEHEVYPARSHQILLEHGYSIFRATGSRFGPLLLPPQAKSRQPFLPPVYPPNYLATIDPSRAQARFRARGWQALPRRLRKYPN